MTYKRPKLSYQKSNHQEDVRLKFTHIRNMVDNVIETITTSYHKMAL